MDFGHKDTPPFTIPTNIFHQVILTEFHYWSRNVFVWISITQRKGNAKILIILLINLKTIYIILWCSRGGIKNSNSNRIWYHWNRRLDCTKFEINNLTFFQTWIVQKENDIFTWLRGLSGDFFHSFQIMSLYWVCVRPGFSSFNLGSSASSKAYKSRSRKRTLFTQAS